MAAIGPAWGPGTWADDVWAFGTWGDDEEAAPVGAVYGGFLRRDGYRTHYKPKELREDIKRDLEQVEPEAARVMAEYVPDYHAGYEAEAARFKATFEREQVEYRDLYLRLLMFEIEIVRLEDEGVIVMMAAMLNS